MGSLKLKKDHLIAKVNLEIPNDTFVGRQFLLNLASFFFLQSNSRRKTKILTLYDFKHKLNIDYTQAIVKCAYGLNTFIY